MEGRGLRSVMSFGIPDLALECVMSYIDDPRDRNAISLVCRKWYRIDAMTRKHITLALCYTTTPGHLRKRFPRLESLKLKGQPRAAMFNLVPHNWGGYVTPWVNEIAVTEAFNCLKSLHFRRMIVRDSDLEVLARARGHMLLSLKLDWCSGFSTDGLLHVARSCRCLRTLVLHESFIEERDGNWLHELAMKNTVLETLNFYMAELNLINIRDLEMIARNCRSLVSLKISDWDIMDLVDVLRAATTLEEFGGGSFNDQVGEVNKYSVVALPPNLCQVGFSFLGKNEMSVLFPCAPLLKKLDLKYTLLNTEDHCQLIQRCPNLEILEARNVIGDRGLEILARNCKKLRRLRVEHGDDDEDEHGRLTQKGLSALAQGCPELEYLAAYVSDITNTALETIGTFSKNLSDFRLVLLDNEERITDSPLDNGVRALLMGCPKLRRFAFHVRPGDLSDAGLGYIGKYSNNISCMLLGGVGETDAGLMEFSTGCPSLQKLEMVHCCFSEHALGQAVLRLRSLRYIWVHGYKSSALGSDLFRMFRPYWNIEFTPPGQFVVYDEFGQPDEAGPTEPPAQIFAYYSLAGQRTDYPATVIPLFPCFLLRSGTLDCIPLPLPSTSIS